MDPSFYMLIAKCHGKFFFTAKSVKYITHGNRLKRVWRYQRGNQNPKINYLLKLDCEILESVKWKRLKRTVFKTHEDEDECDVSSKVWGQHQ